MSAFTDNWKFQEQYISDIKDILRRNSMHIVSIDIAKPDDDMKHATDYKIKITSGDIAVRIRRAYRDFRDLTIRAKNGSSRTEIHKLREGCGDWYLYCWTNDSGAICDWILVDIHKMREAQMFNEYRPVKMNTDGYTGFVAYTIPELISAKALVSRK